MIHIVSTKPARSAALAPGTSSELTIKSIETDGSPASILATLAAVCPSSVKNSVVGSFERESGEKVSLNQGVRELLRK